MWLPPARRQLLSPLARKRLPPLYLARLQIEFVEVEYSPPQYVPGTKESTRHKTEFRGGVEHLS